MVILSINLSWKCSTNPLWKTPTRVTMTTLAAAERQPVDLLGMKLWSSSPMLLVKIFVNVTYCLLPHHRLRHLNSLIRVSRSNEKHPCLTDHVVAVPFWIFVKVLDFEPWDNKIFPLNIGRLSDL